MKSNMLQALKGFGTAVKFVRFIFSFYCVSYLGSLDSDNYFYLSVTVKIRDDQSGRYRHPPYGGLLYFYYIGANKGSIIEGKY